MQIAIIQFPGSNCERETGLAVKRAGMTPVEFLWNESHEKLMACDGYVIVGGFSYEDRSRAGAIAALDPVIDIIKTQSELGKPVLGICNGAQILVEAGLVPGLKNYAQDLALTDNQRLSSGNVLGTGYYNAWINLKPNPRVKPNAFTTHLKNNSLMHIPLAHAEGRFVIPKSLLNEIEAEGLAVFNYCDHEGQVIDEFPINPNGSVHNIAALANKAGNVLAIMPHPERSTHGDAIFLSMRDFIASGKKPPFTPLAHEPQKYTIEPYILAPGANELVIELIITDNHALSVENVLRQKGIHASIKRQVHWEILSDSLATFEKIKNSGLLYNSRKEFIVKKNLDQHQQSFLIRPKDGNLLGLHQHQELKKRFSMDGIETIRHGILWQISLNHSADQETLAHLVQEVLHTRVLFNPASHQCFAYV